MKQQYFIEVHSGLSALLADKSNLYQGLWLSSLTNSAIKGIPDNEIVSIQERIELVREVRNVSQKPIMVDADTGGSIEHFPYWVKQFEKAGVNYIMIEDKCFPKKNSLLDGVIQELEDVDIFSQKIKVGKEITKNIKIYARLESLIAKKSMHEAFIRADAYIKAGADGIMIHSKQKVECTEVMEFAEKFKKEYPNIPLAAVPTTYILPNENPFDIIIHANYLLRASLKAMQNYFDGKNPELASVEDIFNIVGK